MMMRDMPKVRAALALLPCLLLSSALAGACSSSGAPTLASVQGNQSADAASAMVPRTDGGGSTQDSEAPSNDDASNPQQDATFPEQDSSSTPLPDARPDDDARILFTDASEFPEAGSFDATQPFVNVNCDGPNAAPTCCANDNTCVASSDTTCGRAGFPCVDCTATSQICGAGQVCQ
jgi:hypothetical protein